MSQFEKKEKLESLIKELSPTYSIKGNFENIEFIGFDILEENKNHINKTKFIFSQGRKFYIVLYGKVKKIQDKNHLRRFNVRLVHEDGAYFRSKEVAHFIGTEETKDTVDKWKIGGVYKIRFAFKTPEYAFPGVYKFVIARGKYDDPTKGSPQIIDKIIIRINRIKTQEIKNAKNNNLSLEGCLLNPAIQMNTHVELPWIGNIELYIDKNIKEYKKIIVSAKGTQTSGIFPLLKIFVNKIEIGSTYVNNEWKNYTFNLNISKEKHILKIRFDNDEKKLNEDRNMYINMITLLK